MSTIIKSGGGQPRLGAAAVQRIAFNFDDMSSRANQYLDQIRAQAAKILQQANQQAAAIRKQAEEQGRQGAIKAVERIMDDKLSKQLQTLLPALQQIGQEIAHAKQAWLNHWQHSAVRVATAIAGRVIRREVAADPRITLGLVTEALELAAGNAEIAIHLHPTDLQTLGEQVRQITASLGAAGTATLVPDAQVSPGGCRVETRFGTIDQQFEAQLKRIEEELAD